MKEFGCFEHVPHPLAVMNLMYPMGFLIIAASVFPIIGFVLCVVVGSTMIAIQEGRSTSA